MEDEEEEEEYGLWFILVYIVNGIKICIGECVNILNHPKSLTRMEMLIFQINI